MLLSMTGYGEARQEDDAVSVAIEVRALNNRYLKVTLRAADPYNLLEPEVEKVVRRSVRRGTVQVNLRYDRQSAAGDFRINAMALGSYLRQVQALTQDLGLGELEPALVSQVLALPGVVAESALLPADVNRDWPRVEAVLDEALARLQAMRREEGQAMAQEFRTYRQQIADELERIRRLAPGAVAGYRDRLHERVRTLLSELDIQIDRSDLIREVSIFAERSDVMEEVVRLGSHLDQFATMMEEEQSPGRKLEFLIQEMFREANTIGSKAAEVEISRRVVEIKAILERMRELVQNVE